MLEFQVLDTDGHHWRGIPRKQFEYIGRSPDHRFIVESRFGAPFGLTEAKEIEVFLFGQSIGRYAFNLGYKMPEGASITCRWQFSMTDERTGQIFKAA